jgi:hypothetical protein
LGEELSVEVCRAGSEGYLHLHRIPHGLAFLSARGKAASDQKPVRRLTAKLPWTTIRIRS